MPLTPALQRRGRHISTDFEAKETLSQKNNTKKKKKKKKKKTNKWLQNNTKMLFILSNSAIQLKNNEERTLQIV